MFKNLKNVRTRIIINAILLCLLFISLVFLFIDVIDYYKAIRRYGASDSFLVKEFREHFFILVTLITVSVLYFIFAIKQMISIVRNPNYIAEQEALKKLRKDKKRQKLQKHIDELG